MATRGDQAAAIARACGNSNPQGDIISALVGWSEHETTGPDKPGNNMLACALYQPGATPFNSFGNGMHVWNYPDMAAEAAAISANLYESFAGYAALKSAIARGVWDGSVAEGLKTWSGGAYGDDWADFISRGAPHVNEDYETGAIVEPPPPAGYVAVTTYPESGSTLNEIASAHSLTLEELLAFSQNEQYRANPDLVHPGDQVYVGTPAPEPKTYTVERGDSLWYIAIKEYGYSSDDAADIQAAVQKLYAANVGVIGADPDLIRPGQVLEIPQ